MTFNAVVIDKDGPSGISRSIQKLTVDQLPPGNVTVAVEYSTVNFKDGLCMSAVTESAF